MRIFNASLAIVAGCLLVSACSSQEEMAPKPAPTPAAPAPAAKAETKAPAEKAKATKIAGDVGLLDTEKNYLIIVSKEGKLVTIDFDPKFQPVEKTPHPAKMTDVGLGSSAVVQYTKQGDKNVATSVEFLPAKGE
jgi:hypothetical protein